MITEYGAPLPTDEVAGELAQITGRVREHFAEVAPRLLRGTPFFPVAGGLAYGLRSWLLDLTSEREDDLLFYNYSTRTNWPRSNRQRRGWTGQTTRTGLPAP